MIDENLVDEKAIENGLGLFLTKRDKSIVNKTNCQKKKETAILHNCIGANFVYNRRIQC